MTRNVNNEVRVCTNNPPETKAQAWDSVSVSSSVYCFTDHRLHVYHHQGAMSKICGITGLWSTHACVVSGPSTSHRGRTKVKMYFSKQWKLSAMAIICACPVTFLNTDFFFFHVSPSWLTLLSLLFPQRHFFRWLQTRNASFTLCSQIPAQMGINTVPWILGGVHFYVLYEKDILFQLFIMLTQNTKSFFSGWWNLDNVQLWAKRCQKLLK